MNYGRFLSRTALARQPSPIRRLTEIQMSGGAEVISFGTGAPNPALFPFESLKVRTKDGVEMTMEGAELTAALQYGPTSGNPQLVAWLKELQQSVHKPQVADLDLILTPGSQDGLSKIFEMILNPGDPILIEEPTYPGTLAGLNPMGLQYLGVASDGSGLRPDALLAALKPYAADSPKRPKLLVVQPGPSNPTGRSISTSRRQDILDLAKEFDFLVVEDDPYYFLNFEEPPPSFLSLDTEGRVIRTDSFSKMMSSGFRLGMVTGPAALVNRVMLHLQVTSMHASSLSQALVLRVLQEWGLDGFLDHSQKVSSFYASQCAAMLAAAEAELGGLAEWAEPSGGMFLWLKALGIRDTAALINTHALEEKIVLAPGNIFYTNPRKPSPYLRASYSNVTPDQMREGMKRLARLLKSHQKH